MLISVNYHYIRERFDTPYPSIFGVTPEQFSSQLDLLGRDAVFLSALEISAIIGGQKQLPPRAAIVTFDDGFREQYELAWPILQKKGIPAIFFVNTRTIDETFVVNTHKVHLIRAYTSPGKLLNILQQICEKEKINLHLPEAGKAGEVYKYDTSESARIKYFLNHELRGEKQELIIDKCFKELGFDEALINPALYMTREMISSLAEEGMLGTHGHSHLPLGLLTEEEAKVDLDLSISKLKQWTGCDMSALSYPFGFKRACSPAIAKHARCRKIKFAFTMERAGNKILDQPMFLARFSETDLFKSGQLSNSGEFWKNLPHADWFRQSALI